MRIKKSYFTGLLVAGVLAVSAVSLLFAQTAPPKWRASFIDREPEMHVAVDQANADSRTEAERLDFQRGFATGLAATDVDASGNFQVYVGNLTTLEPAGGIAVYTLNRDGFDATSAGVAATMPSPTFSIAPLSGFPANGAPSRGGNYGRSIVVRDSSGGGPDLLVGAPAYAEGSGNRGRTYSHFLSPNGLIDSARTFASRAGREGSPFGETGSGNRYGSALAYDANAPTANLAVGSEGVFPNISGRNVSNSEFETVNGGAIFLFTLQNNGDGANENRHIPGGLEEGDLYGHSVAWLGDAGAGRRLLAVGAPSYEMGGTEDPRVYFHRVNNFNVETNVEIRPDSTAAPDGLAGSRYGNAVAGPGDLNGDGVPDLIVGAPYYGSDDATATGAVFVHLMNADGTILDTLRMEPTSVELGKTGRAGNDAFRFGRSLTVADLGNGQRALLVGAGYAQGVGDFNGGSVYFMAYPELFVVAYDEVDDAADGAGRTVGSVVPAAAAVSRDVMGIAVAGVEAGGIGVWQFQLAGETTWTPVAAAQGNARLLAADSRLRFLLNDDASVTGGSSLPSLTAHLWNGDGTAGDEVAVAAAGDAGSVLSRATRLLQLGPPEQVVVPVPVAAPEDITVNSIKITWAPVVQTAPVASYRVSVTDDAGAAAGEELTVDVSETLQYTAENLTRGTQYTFSVIAVDINGTDGEAGILRVHTSFETPSVPQGLTITRGSGVNVTASWSAPSETGGPPSATLEYFVELEDVAAGEIYGSDVTTALQIQLALRPAIVSRVYVAARTADSKTGPRASTTVDLQTATANIPPIWQVDLADSAEPFQVSWLTAPGVERFGTAIAASEVDETGRFELLVSSAGTDNRGQIRIYTLNAADLFDGDTEVGADSTPYVLDATNGIGSLPGLARVINIRDISGEIVNQEVREVGTGYGASIVVLERSAGELHFAAGVPIEAADGEGVVYFHSLSLSDGAVSVTRAGLVFSDEALNGVNTVPAGFPGSFNCRDDAGQQAECTNDSAQLDEVRNNALFGSALIHDADARPGEVNLIVGARANMQTGLPQKSPVLFPYFLRDSGMLDHAVHTLCTTVGGAIDDVLNGYCLGDGGIEPSVIAGISRYGAAAAWLGRVGAGENERRLLAVGAPGIDSIFIHSLEAGTGFNVVDIHREEISQELQSIIYGEALAAIGDVDGDGVPDLAASRLPRNPADIINSGIYIYLLNADGTVKRIARPINLFTGTSGTGDSSTSNLAGIDLSQGEAIVSQFGAALAVINLGDNRRALAVNEFNNDRVVFIPYELPEVYRLTQGDAGVSVATIVGDNGLDSDASDGAVESVAVTASDNGGVGTWEYLTDGAWTPFPSIGEAQGLLLGPTAQLRFRLSDGSSLDVTALPSLSLRLWDQNTGTQGEVVPVLNPGAADRASPFSAGVRRVEAVPTPATEAAGNVMVARDSSTEISVTWSAPDASTLGGAGGVLSYLVSWALESAPEMIQGTARVPGTETSYTVRGLAEDVRYIFTVTVLNGDATQQGPVSQSQGLSAAVPSAPTNLRAVDRQFDSFTVMWEAPASDGGSPILNYQIRIEQSSDGAVIDSMVLSPQTFSFVQDALPVATSYDIEVAAVNAGGVGSTATLTVTTLEPPPQAPSNVETSATSQSLTLTWDAPGGDVEAAEYQATWVNTDTNNSNSRVVTAPVTTLELTVSGDGLVPGATYTATVLARNADGLDSAPEAASPATIRIPTVPGSPAAPMLTVAARQLDITWQAPTDNGGATVENYIVYWAADSGPEFSRDATTLSFSLTLRTDIASDDLEDDTRYSVSVAAANENGTGSRSAIAAIVLPDEPATPTISRIAPSTDSLTVFWEAPEDTGGAPISEYTLYYMATVNGTEMTTTATADVRSAMITGLTSDTAYQVRMSATNGVGEGPRTLSEDTRTFPSQPDAPTAVEASMISPTAFTVMWTPPDNTGGAGITLTGYRVAATVMGDPSSRIVSDEIVVTSHELTGLAKGTVYEVTVTAFNSEGGESVSSQVVRVTTLTTPPDAPSTPNATAGVDQLAVDWIALDAADGDITGGAALGIAAYIVYWAPTTTPAAESSLTLSFTGDAEADTSLTLTVAANQVARGTTYTVSVAAQNTEPLISSRSPATMTLTALPDVPTTPTNLVLTAARDQLQVDWDESDGRGRDVLDYTVLWSPANTAGDTSATVTAVSDYTIESLAEVGSTYTVSVTARNEVGVSIPVTGMKMTLAVLPSTPQNVTFPTSSLMDDSFVVEWEVPAQTGSLAPLNYAITWERETAPGTFEQVGSAETQDTMQAVTGLLPFTNYRVSVVASNQFGASATAVAERETLQGTPGPITMFEITDVGINEFTISWAFDEPNGSLNDINFLLTINSEGVLPGIAAIAAARIEIVQNRYQLVVDSNTINNFDILGGVIYNLILRADNRSNNRASSEVRVDVATRTLNSPPVWSAVTTIGLDYAQALDNVDDGTGRLLSAIIPVNEITDSDEDTPPASVAVVGGLDGGVGSWQYRLTQDGVWTAITLSGASSLTNTNALLLDENASLRFVVSSSIDPAALPRLSVRVWDQSDSGASGEFADTTGAGTADTAFSAQTRFIEISPVAPGAPQNLVGLGTDSGGTILSVTWDAPIFNGGAAITSYDIASVLEDAVETLNFTTTDAPDSHEITGLEKGTTYQVSVRANNAVGDGTVAEVLGRTAVTAPSAPFGLSALPTADGFTASWQVPDDDGGARDGIVSYEVFWQGSGIVEGSQVTEMTTLTVTGLPGDIYGLAVVAINRDGGTQLTSARSVGVSVRVPLAAPQVPDNVQTSATSQSLTVMWDVPTSGVPVAEYLVTWTNTADSSSASSVVTAPATRLELTVTDGGLVPGASYGVTVLARNEEGLESAPVEATPASIRIPTIPDQLAATTLTVSVGQLEIMWQAPDDDGGATVSEYIVYWETGSGGSALAFNRRVAATPPLSLTLRTDAFGDNLEAGAGYAVSVVAVNENGESARSVATSATLPAAPAAPTITGIIASTDRLTVSWQAPDDGGDPITGYTLYYMAADGGTEMTLAPAADATFAVVTALTPNTAYQVALSATNGVGEGPQTLSMDTMTFASQPGAPTNITIPDDLIGPTAFTVMWTVPTDAGGTGLMLAGYQVTVTLGDASTSVNVNDPAATNHRLIALNKGTAYEVTVIAINNEAGESVPSETVDVTTLTTPPDTPSMPSAIVGVDQLEVDWTALDAADGNVTGGAGLGIDAYIVYWAPTATLGDESSLTLSFNGDVEADTSLTLTVADAQVARGVAYTVSVAARNTAAVISSRSPTTMTLTPLPNVPVALANLVVIPARSGDQLAVEWDDSDGRGSAVLDYTVQWSPAGTTGETSATVTVSNYTIESLMADTAYTVSVRARNAVGVGAQRQRRVVTPDIAPNAPTRFALSAEEAAVGEPDALIRVEWSPPAEGGGSPTSYEVYWAAEGEALVSPDGPEISDTSFSGFSYGITGLAKGTAYTVTVAAVNNIGETRTGEQTITTDVTLSSAPQTLVLAPADQAIDVSWEAPADSGGLPVTYTLRWNAGTSIGEGDIREQASITATNSTITGLDNGAAYTVEVIAVNTEGLSAPTAPQTITLPESAPEVPSNVQTSATSQSLTVVWDAPASGVTVAEYLVTWTNTADSSSTSSMVTAPATRLELTVADDGLVPGASYGVTVLARNAEGLGSAPVDAAPAAIRIPTVPATPMITNVAPGIDRLTVSWQAPDNGGVPITGYTLYYMAADGVTEMTLAAAADAISAVITGLMQNTAYELALTATNDVGESPRAERNAMTSLSQPGAPTDIAIPNNLIAPTAFTVMWTPPTDTGSVSATLTGYRVIAAAGDASTSVNVNDPMATSHRLIALNKGTAYAVTVTASNSEAGESVPSEVVNVTTLTTRPDTPSTPSAIVGVDQLEVDWTALDATDGNVTGGALLGIESYIVYWAPTTTPEDESSLTLSFTGDAEADTSLTLTVADAQVARGTAYTVSVAARNTADDISLQSPTTMTLTPLADVPTVPTSLVLTPARTGDQLAVAWDDSDDRGSAVLGYTVLWSPADTAGETSATVTVSDYTIGSLMVDTPYTVSVTARNAVGVSAPVTGMAMTPNIAPNEPSNLILSAEAAVVGVPEATITVTWDAPVAGGGSPTSYEVYWAAEGEVLVSPDGPEVTDTTASSYTYDIPGLPKGTRYTVTVAAVNSIDETRAAEQTMRTVVTLSSAPQNLMLTPADQAIGASWDAPADSGGLPVTYTLRWNAGTAIGEGDITEQELIATTNVTITGLANRTEYAVEVIAVNTEGSSAPTAPQTITLPELAPEVPGNVQTSATSQSLTVMWDTPASGVTVMEYLVTWTNIADSSSASRVVTAPATRLELTVATDGLVPGASYGVTVLARNVEGLGSAPVDAAPAEIRIPTSPDQLATPTLAATIGQLEITWQVPGDNGGATVENYIVYWVAGLDLPPMEFSRTISAPSLSLILRTDAPGDNLEAGESYAVSVAAMNENGVGERSAAVLATLPDVPATPMIMNVAPGLDHLTVSWQAPDDGGVPITGYTLYYMTADGGTEMTLAAAADAVSAVITGLTQNTTYELALTATNDVGESPRAERNAMTSLSQPGAPTDITIPDNLIAPTAFTVMWTAPTDTGSASATLTGYRVTATAADGPTSVDVNGSVAISHQFTGLDKGTAYAVTVTAINNEGGESVPSEVVNVTTLTTPPDAPSTPSAIVGVDQLEVDWTALDAADGNVTGGADLGIDAYIVYWAPTTTPEDESSFTLSFSDTEADTSLTLTVADAQVARGTAYTVSVAARNTDAAISLQSPTTMTLTPLPDVPTVPTSLVLTPAPSGDELAVAWDDSDDRGSAVLGYTVLWSPADTAGETSATVTLSDYTIGSLTVDTPYTVSVTARNAVGVSAPVTETARTPNIAPNEPSNLILSAEAAAVGVPEATITVTWDAPVAGGGSIASYEVYWAVEGEALVSPGGSEVTDTTASSYTYDITGLIKGTTYTVTVAAVNSITETRAAEQTVMTVVTLSSAPQNLVLTSADQAIDVSWEAPADSGGLPVTYTLRWSTGTAIAEESVEVQTLIDSTGFTITGLENRTEYTVEVIAVNAEGNSAPTAPQTSAAGEAALRLRLRVFLEGALQ